MRWVMKKKRHPALYCGTSCLLCILALFIGTITLQTSRAEDWPQWRGPQRDGVWRETGILEKIPAAGLKMRWRARVGGGYSGPAVAGGRVFVSDRQADPEVERVLCFDEATGEQLWAHSYPCDYEGLEYGAGPRATPTVHDGKVYTLGAKGHLFCLRASGGEVLWKKDLVAEYDALPPRWGVSAAPLVVDDLLIVCAGGRPDASVIAFDRNTGEQRWKALGDGPAYSAPIMVEAGGTQQVIVWTADHIAGLNPTTGEVFWKGPYKSLDGGLQAIASPVLRNQHLLFLGAFSGRSLMMKLDPKEPTASVLWQTRKKPSTSFSTPLFLSDQHFYASLSGGVFGCLDAATGDEIWTDRAPIALDRLDGSVHITPNEDRVFLFNQKGHLITAILTPQGYEETGRCLLLEPAAAYRASDPVNWAHPAYANRCVFARSDRELICASLAAGDLVDAPAEAPEQIEARILPVGPAQGVAVAPDGAVFATKFSSKVRVFEWPGAKEIEAPAKHRYPLAAIAFSPDGKLLASVGGTEWKDADGSLKKDNAEVVLWDVTAGVERARFKEQLHGDKVMAVAFSPDGKTLATGGADRTIKLVDVETLKVRATLEGHVDAVGSLAFSPDGSTLVSAGWDRVVRFWDPVSGKESGRLASRHPEEIRSLAFSPDGSVLATGCADWKVRLWDVATKTERAVLEGHRGTVYSVAISPDGSVLATGSGDQTVKLWNLATGKLEATLIGHESGVTSVAFTPDGEALASAGRDDALRIWTLNDG